MHSFFVAVLLSVCLASTDSCVQELENMLDNVFVVSNVVLNADVCSFPTKFNLTECTETLVFIFCVTVASDFFFLSG